MIKVAASTLQGLGECRGFALTLAFETDVSDRDFESFTDLLYAELSELRLINFAARLTDRAVDIDTSDVLANDPRSFMVDVQSALHGAGCEIAFVAPRTRRGRAAAPGNLRDLAKVGADHVVTLHDPQGLGLREQAAYERGIAEGWVNGVRWAAAEADAQASWREPVYILDISDHLRACASNPARRSAVPRDSAPDDFPAAAGHVGPTGILDKALADIVAQAEARGLADGIEGWERRYRTMMPGTGFWVAINEEQVPRLRGWAKETCLVSPWKPTEQPEGSDR